MFVEHFVNEANKKNIQKVRRVVFLLLKIDTLNLFESTQGNFH
jgi:hypothetical protein